MKDLQQGDKGTHFNMAMSEIDLMIIIIHKRYFDNTLYTS